MFSYLKSLNVFSLPTTAKSGPENGRSPRAVATEKTAANLAQDKLVLIDGNNLIYGAPGHQEASFLNVLGLVSALASKGIRFKVFHDANAFFILKDAGKKDEAYCYRRLCHDFADWFIEVPGHDCADDYLLHNATACGGIIVSNDRYRDYAEKYPWLNTQSDRRVSHLVHSGKVQVLALEIDAALPTRVSDAEENIRQLYRQLTGRLVPLYPKSASNLKRAVPSLRPATA